MDIKFLRITNITNTLLNTYPVLGDGVMYKSNMIKTDYEIAYDYRVNDDSTFRSDIICVSGNLAAEEILTAIYKRIERAFNRDQEKKALQIRIQHLHDLNVYNDGINKKGKE